MGIPWLLIVGDQDIEDNTVSVRLRTDEDLGAVPMNEFVEKAKNIIDTHSPEINFNEPVAE